MSVFDTITFAIACIGAILGLINTWRSYDRDRVKLKVRAMHAFGEDYNDICIEVTNLSTFPVTVYDVGFDLKDTEDRLCLFQPRLNPSGKLPIRMEPRTSFTAYPSYSLQLAQAELIREPYAKTSCGHKSTGDAKAAHRIAISVASQSRPSLG